MKKICFLLFAVVLFASCANKNENSLFNGKDLTGWYTYLAVPDSSVITDLPRDSAGHYYQALGLNNDIFKVFSVVETEGAPAIRISGEVFGILVSENEFENYHLTMEFKWGEEKFAPRADKKRDSGILYNSVGKEGAWGGVWMKSKEFQVQEGDVADFILVDTATASIPCVFDSVNNYFKYSEKGESKEYTVNFAYCHKSENFEKPNGEWNKVEIYSIGGNSVHVVNGNVVLRCYDSKVLENGEMVTNSKGKIQLQSEGAEVFYRNIKLEQITEFPAGIGM